MTTRRFPRAAAAAAIVAALTAAALSPVAGAGTADNQVNLEAVRSEGGRYYTAEDVPTYNVAEDGTLDWLAYSGFRRYHAECHVCHGPDGEGSTYAPPLKDSAVRMDYYEFVGVVASGIENVNASQQSVMPSFAVNPNVMCYVDDIYVYLKARGADAIPRGRPAKKEPKSDEITEAEDACMGG